MTKVRKAVIPAAGLGTRFLPATKSQPKEMLPIVDKPAIQYVVEEAVLAGLTDVLVITGRGKRAIEDHFDRNFELEYFLEQSGRDALLAEMREINELADFHYIRQRDPLGLGHAVSVAQAHVGDEPFVVMLGDDLIHPSEPLLGEMLRAHDTFGRSVIAAMEVSKQEISMYGCIQPEPFEEDLVRILSIIEKPSPEEAPSNLAVIGRYVLTPEIFDALRRTTPGRGGEIQLTDAINALMEEQEVYGYAFEGTRYDAGTTMGWLKASVELALQRPELATEFREYLKSVEL